MGETWSNICDFPEITRYQSFKELIADSELNQYIKDIKIEDQSIQDKGYEELSYQIVKKIQDIDIKLFNEEFVQEILEPLQANYTLISNKKVENYEKFVEEKRELVANFANVIDYNKSILLRAERNRFLIYKRPID